MTEKDSSVKFSVRMGDQGTVFLDLEIKNRGFPIPLSSGRAALLGKALLSASVVDHAGKFRPIGGAAITNCLIPVITHKGGVNAGTTPVLILQTYGMTELAFQFRPEDAEVCGRNLAELGVRLREA